MRHDIFGFGYEQVLIQIPKWWQDIRDSDHWDTFSFYWLALAYTVLAVVALVQLVRISQRCPQYGWTTQKVFHLLNLLVCLLRAVVMVFHKDLEGMTHAMLKLLLNDFPGLLFFTTYTLLVLFWAEIYHQARSQDTTRLRPTFLYSNVFVYFVQLGLLLLSCLPGKTLKEMAKTQSAIFLVGVSLCAAGGFLTYGGRLFVMLRRFPIESPGRLKKLREVGVVTIVCTLSFTLRAAMVTLATIDSTDFKLDVFNHPLLNIAYYAAVEVIPSALVLFMLRKLPPKRTPVYTSSDLEAQ